MNFLSRFFGRTETREQSLGVATQRDLHLVDWMGGDHHFGQSVNAVRGEWLSAVTAAVDAIAGTIASLPARVYRLTGAGREEDSAHPLAAIVRDGPNQYQTWPDFIQWLVAQVLRYGNGLAEKVLDNNGVLIELRPLPWERVAPKILLTRRLVFDFSDPVTLEWRRLLDTDVLHLRDRSDNGLLGVARHVRAHPVIAAALALTEYAGNQYKNGAYPSGVLQADGKLSSSNIEQLRVLFSSLFSGPSNAAKALILDQGIKWQSVTATPEDMELLAARRFAIEEAARLYQVPPPIIGDLSHGTFTNSETLIRFFAQSTLANWCAKIEAEVHRSIFTDAARRTRVFELDLSGLLRGDPETRWKSHAIALQNHVLTPNEVRGVEGWNPRPGGDQFAPAPPAIAAAGA